MPLSNASAAERSSIDRPDIVSGYQIHAVYVVPKNGVDLKLDTEGQINSWITSSNLFLQSQIGRKLKFDLYAGGVDVTYLQSKYELSELCYSNCETLEKLSSELEERAGKSFRAKTTVFFFSDNLDQGSCGWASRPGNIALVHNVFAPGCSSQIAEAIAHEIFHTYGIGHTCLSKVDLMLGGSCTITSYIGDPTVVGFSGTNYVGSDKAFGVDILKMPVWIDGNEPGDYSRITQSSDNYYLPKLKDGTIYAIVGYPSSNFSWNWPMKLGDTDIPNGRFMRIENGEITCSMSSGVKVITGISRGTSCVFDVPENWRVGQSFQVTQKWIMGPWNGSVVVSGKLLRADLSSSPCNQEVCFVGGSTVLPSSCWNTTASEILLQKVVMGAWQNVSTVPLVSSGKCSQSYPKQPEYKYSFENSGTEVFRWYIKPTSTQKGFADTPFAVLVSGAEEREANDSEVKLANERALDLGKAADLVPPPADTSCKITSNGLTCTSTINDKQNWEDSNGGTFSWYAAIVPIGSMSSSGVVPQGGVELSSSQMVNASSSIQIPYEKIQQLNGGLSSAIQVYTIARNTLGKGSVFPGEQSIVSISEIKTSIEAARAIASKKMISITCTKGKIIKKVTGLKPVCPIGYKKK